MKLVSALMILAGCAPQPVPTGGVGGRVSPEPQPMALSESDAESSAEASVGDTWDCLVRAGAVSPRSAASECTTMRLLSVLGCPEGLRKLVSKDGGPLRAPGISEGARVTVVGRLSMRTPATSGRTLLATLVPASVTAIPVEGFAADVAACSGVVDVVLEGTFRKHHPPYQLDGCGGPYFEDVVLLRRAETEEGCTWPVGGGE